MVKYFKWDSDFLSGIEEIDKQHYGLVETINEMVSLSLNIESVEKETFVKLQDKLLQYVKVHFNTEEEMMMHHSVDMRHVNEHKKIHYEFVHEITVFFEKFEISGRHTDLDEIVEYLVRWLAYHILNTDKSLARQIESIKQAVSPEDAYMEEESRLQTTTEPLLKALKLLYKLVLEKNREIEKQNLDLEETVKTRTKELIELNAELEKLTLHDTLTNLPNRRFVMIELEKLMDSWERYNTPFSVLFVDVDKFKSVNDVYGHKAGDLVLKWIADFLSHNTRKTDIVSRLGGDEFVVICTQTEKSEASLIAQHLNEKCKNLIIDGVEDWKPSLSIGVATMNDKIKSTSDILSKADEAMYVSKSAGGGQTVES